jgi:hypothetical protein
MRVTHDSSDHYLLVTAERLRLKRYSNTNNDQKKFHIGIFRSKKRQVAFKISSSTGSNHYKS